MISRLVILYNFKLREGSFQALVARPWQVRGSRGHQVEQRLAGASRRLSLVREHEPWHARTHAHYDRDQPRVPFNTPEAATSSSSADSSPELPRRKEKVRASNFSNVPFQALVKVLSALRQSAVHQTSLELAEDDEELHLDLGRADQLASYCRTKLNRVTARTLYTATMEMRRRDTCCYISTRYLLHIY